MVAICDSAAERRVRGKSYRQRHAAFGAFCQGGCRSRQGERRASEGGVSGRSLGRHSSWRPSV
jgi:hypothetical protein